MTTDVVHRIHQLARPSSSSKKKQRAYDNFTFEWAAGSPVRPLLISDLLPLLGASEEPSSEQEQPPFEPIPEIPPNDDDFINEFRDDDVICEPNDVHGVAPINANDVGIQNNAFPDNASEVDIESANEFGSQNQDLSINDVFEQEMQTVVLIHLTWNQHQPTTPSPLFSNLMPLKIISMMSYILFKTWKMILFKNHIS